MVPALIGLVLKLILLAYAVIGRNASASLIALIVTLALHNLIELVGYVLLPEHQSLTMLFRSYYVVGIVGLLLISHLAVTTSKISLSWPTPLFASWALLLISMVVFSDQIVDGYYAIEYAISATQGDYYLAFALFPPLVLLTVMVLLYLGLRRAGSQLDASRCLYWLVALTPIILGALLILSFKLFDLHSNVAGLISLATTFFTYLIIRSTTEQRLTDIRRFLPFTIERRTAAKLLEITDAYTQKTNEENAYSEFRDSIERQAILYTIKKCDGNITETTRMMGLQNRSTLYSMFKRLNIDPPTIAKAKLKE